MPCAIDALQITLEEILDACPVGLSEHDLLKDLAARKVTFFDDDYFNSPLGLFQRHFLLFHCLYLLRDKLRRGETSDLNIDCLCIRIIPSHDTSSPHPAMHDPLAAYYLDIDHLKSTEKSDMLRMLDGFWKRFAGENQRDAALAEMELTHPTNYSEIKQQYRRLAMRRHPDRGGDAAQFHRLEWAMGVLRVLYQEDRGGGNRRLRSPFKTKHTAMIRNTRNSRPAGCRKGKMGQ